MSPYRPRPSRRRLTTTQRGYDSDWQRRSRAAIVAEPWCHNPDCDHADAGTAANRLQGDHPRSLASGGSPHQVPVVLCQRCNGRKGG
jgi:hypothetical protein